MSFFATLSKLRACLSPWARKVFEVHLYTKHKTSRSHKHCFLLPHAQRQSAGPTESFVFDFCVCWFFLHLIPLTLRFCTLFGLSAWAAEKAHCVHIQQTAMPNQLAHWQSLLVRRKVQALIFFDYVTKSFLYIFFNFFYVPKKTIFFFK